MVGAEVHGRLDVHHREARERTRLERLADALLDRRDVLRRNHAALDLVDELEALARLLRSELEADVRVLTAAAGLLDVLVLVVDRHRDRLAIRDLRSADVAVDVELAFQTVDDDLEIELAHAGDDRLGGLLVEGDDEGRVFHRERVERNAELLVVTAGFRLHRDRDDRRREVDGFKRNRMRRIAERVARAGLGETDARNDVAGMRLFERLLLGRVHAEQTADALLAVNRRVKHLRAELHRARIDADERNLAAGLRIVHDLERETAERLVVGNLALLVGIVLRNRRARVKRGREIVADAVEERLNALVLERGAAERRGDGARKAALAERLLDLVVRELLACEKLLHERIVLLGRRLDHLLAVLLRLLHVLLGDVLLENRLAERLHVEVKRFHLDEVDDALERIRSADRDDDRNRVGAELLLHLVHHAVEVRADAVHLVNERNLRHFVLLGLAPHLLGLGLDAADRAVEGDRTVKNAERALHLGREVHVSGGVDQGEAVVAPLDARRGGLNRDAALLLLHHEVHRRGTVVHFADLVVLARIVKDTLRRRRLAAVDVGHDAEVTHSFERNVTLCHFFSP